ncbi:16580_t:CDS:2 [Funneliformis geosporum]|uniref:15152_t:CDS:1 n=1 Tax=Funneliformis geosporum TaxID=1117311 RepID=A0A9W4SM92_9GLOM|nr:16580_t:CDS:2 [Funneliformis geosporum]CAI2174450.1 15152_t:CDS:2 [Funneliformis geosporum]
MIYYYRTFQTLKNFLPYSNFHKLTSFQQIKNQRYLPKNSLSFSTNSKSLIKEIIKNQTSLLIKWSNSNSLSNYNYIWLRDNCQCPLCVHPDNRQKLLSSSEVPLDIKPISIESSLDKLEITWDNDIYPISFLHSYSTKQNILKLHYNHLKPILWDSSSIINSQNLWISYNDYMNSDKILLDSLRQLWDYGLVFIKNVPTGDDDDKGILNVAERIGNIRSTIYGKVFDVKSIPAANNIAYTRLQFLHCLKNSVTGGQSIFSDTFKAIQKLNFHHPNYFNLLTTFPLTFHYINNGHHMYYNRPAIVIDDYNDTLTVNYAPPFQGPIEFTLGSNDDENEINLIEFYRAYQQFCKFIEEPSLKFELTLKPSDLVIFANRRVLHARKSFDPQSGQRHLKEC